ncbi:hypothetical protein SKAU_G00233660 [Synaphobranchus kaupii]|uniref:Uncharacterized protein n=1 Tax=Synaphobranchus kaupii TaxID=118154 RepID=A0A9Q1F692_SYNKA|nr:hypothetical protein SKAU_G00233660 [Synaphobranchus kaupii]
MSDLLVISQMKEQFRQDFDGRYTYLQELLHYASALDPRFKDLAFLVDNDTKDMIFMKITAELVKMDGEMMTAFDQMFWDFLTARAPMKTTRERAKEEILNRGDSMPSLERATKYNPMYESDITTGYSHYYRRYPEMPCYSSASAEASTDFSSEEIRHIYENNELSREEIQDRIRIIELYAKDRQFADFIRQHQVGLETRPWSYARAVTTADGGEPTVPDLESLEQQVTAFFNNKGISVSNNDIEACHPLPRRNKGDIPAIIIRFRNRKHKNALLRQGRKLNCSLMLTKRSYIAHLYYHI